MGAIENALREVAELERRKGKVYRLLGEILETIRKEKSTVKIIGHVEEIFNELQHIWR